MNTEAAMTTTLVTAGESVSAALRDAMPALPNDSAADQTLRKRHAASKERARMAVAGLGIEATDDNLEHLLWVMDTAEAMMNAGDLDGAARWFASLGGMQEAREDHVARWREALIREQLRSITAEPLARG